MEASGKRYQGKKRDVVLFLGIKRSQKREKAVNVRKKEKHLGILNKTNKPKKKLSVMIIYYLALQ